MGPVITLSLAEAREKATELRRDVLEGRDPIDRRRNEHARLQAVPRFGEAALAYIERMAPQWHNKKHVAQWKATLETYCKPIWKKRVDAVDAADALACLQPIWLEKPETAKRVRGRAEAVLDAEAVQRRDEKYVNPFRWKGNMELLLPKRPRGDEGHMAALPYEHMPTFMAELRAKKKASADLLEWQILTACRPGDARFARAEEIKGDLWVIPAERMKMRKEHVVPLSAPALAMLERLPKTGYLFPRPGHPDTPMSEGAAMGIIRVLGYKGKVTAHGFRSSFQDWAGDETEYPDSLVEFALAHEIDDETTAAYRRRKAVERRRGLMDDWASFIAGVSPRRPRRPRRPRPPASGSGRRASGTA